MHRQLFAPALIVALSLALACTPTPTPTATPTATVTLTSTPTATSSPVTVLTTAEVVRRVTPSVVHIRTEVVQLNLFLQPAPVQGTGTGIVYDQRGYIVTNYHVVEDAQQITVTLVSGESYNARLVGGDLFADLAVIQIDVPNLAPARFGDSSALEVGEDVIAIGHAFDLPGGPTVTKGVVSAKERFITVESRVTLDGVIQTDAAINPGNSGGPLVNLKGEVVGINSARLQVAEGLGFAIGINTARPIIEELIQFGRVQRAFLGIGPVNVTPDLVARFDLPIEQGVIVAEVTRGSPANIAGLRQGDVIVRIGDQDVAHTGDLTRILRQYKPGDQANITFYRDSSQRTIQVQFGTAS